MTVNPVNSSSGNNTVSLVQPQPQTQAERAAEIESKKNSDEAQKAAAESAKPQATVNTNGQTVGAIINVKA
jgi:hypothetical protein